MCISITANWTKTMTNEINKLNKKIETLTKALHKMEIAAVKSEGAEAAIDARLKMVSADLEQARMEMSTMGEASTILVRAKITLEAFIASNGPTGSITMKEAITLHTIVDGKSVAPVNKVAIGHDS